MCNPDQTELLRLLDNPERTIELETNQAPAIRYARPFREYVDDFGLRVCVYCPGIAPHANIRLETYRFAPNHDPNAVLHPPDPIMLPHQPDEPLTIDGVDIDPDYAAMALFFRRPVPGPIAPPEDVAALVLCRHEPPQHVHHTHGTRDDCRAVYDPSINHLDDPVTWYRIVPA